jgi:predicted MFS family arabinose efflux permease
MTFLNAFFGMSHIVLLPVFAERLLGDASGSGLAVMYSAAGLGGLMGALATGSLVARSRAGLVVIGGGSVFGMTLVAFAFAPWYWLALVLEWLASASNQLFMVTGQSTLHSQVPDHYRGRVMGVWGMTHTLVMPMGGLMMGGVASGFSATVAVATGGGIVALFAMFGAGGSGRVRSLGRSDAAGVAGTESPVAATASPGEQ